MYPTNNPLLNALICTFPRLSKMFGRMGLGVEAKDLFQKAVLEILEHPALQPHSSMEGLARCVARRAGCKEIERRQREREFRSNDDEIVDGFSPELAGLKQCLADDIEQRDALAHILGEGLSTLTPLEREVILCDLDERPPPKGMSPVAVRQRRHSAISKLQKFWARLNA